MMDDKLITAQRIADFLTARGIPFEQKKMFGGICFMVNDKMCIGVIKDDMMIRIDPALEEEVLSRNGCRVMDFQTRPMKGYFYIDVDGKREALMTFVFAGEDKIIIDHTEVNPGNNGKGFGKMMVLKAVEFAREKNIKILPLCPFAKSVFDKTPEIRDVL